MLRLIIIVCGFLQASLEIENSQRQVNVTRKTRSITNPETGSLVHNKVSEGPIRTTTYDDTYRNPAQKYAEIKTEEDFANNNEHVKNNRTDYQQKRPRIKDKGVYLSLKENEERVKAKTKYLQSKEKDAPVINIHSTTRIHSDFNPNTLKEMFTSYVADREFRIDDEDVRTDSRNTYNGWPFSYNGPYDYQIKKNNSKNEKAKDKRFLGSDTTVTPVQENVVENIPIEYISNAASSGDPVIDNPIYGDQPFFSFVLNDYFDRHHEEDPLIFKDFTWSEEFDNGLSSQDIEDNERRSRRLHNSNKNPNEIQKTDMSETYTKAADKESVTEKTYDNSREYEKHRKDDGQNNHQGSEHNYEGHRKTAFKDFADLFANKFGSEEHSKNSKFMLKSNQDKGENRKGFKRVYHKDEYQEDNEFYDNTNKSIKSEESGDSNFNIGGSQSLLRSQAVGSDGNKGESMTTKANGAHRTFENNYGFNEGQTERDGEINHYRNIAKDAALSNNADYIDTFKI